MKNFTEKYLNRNVLIALNVLIILVVELSGSFFSETGYIHLIAAIFVLFALLMFKDAGKFLFGDRILRRFFQITYAIMVLFSLIHLFEFAAVKDYLHLNHELVDLYVVIMYLASFLFFVSALENLIALSKRTSQLLSRITLFLAFVAVLSPFYFFMTGHTLAQAELFSVVSSFLLLASGGYAIFRMNVVKRVLPVLRGFVVNFRYTIVFITAAGLLEFLELAENSFVPEYQVDNMAHFLFFIGISFYMRALADLYKPKGVYKDFDKITSA